MKRVNGALQQTTWPDAMDAISDGIQAILDKECDGALAVMGSPVATNEENYLLRKLASQAFRTTHIGLGPGLQGESWTAKNGFHIDSDKSPNTRGAAEMLGAEDMKDVLQGIEEGQIRGLYALGGHLSYELSEDECRILQQLDVLVAQDVRRSKLAELADVTLPGAIPFEKLGTMTNARGRIQRLNPACPQPGSARPDLAILHYVAQRMGVDVGKPEPSEVFNEIASVYEEYAAQSYETIGDSGAMIRGEEPSETAGG